MAKRYGALEIMDTSGAGRSIQASATFTMSNKHGGWRRRRSADAGEDVEKGARLAPPRAPVL